MCKQVKQNKHSQRSNTAKNLFDVVSSNPTYGSKKLCTYYLTVIRIYKKNNDEYF
jgi:hypothetical protein